MKRLIIISLLLTMFLAGCSHTNERFNYKHATVILGNQKVNVEVAETNDEMMYGLMNRTHLDANAGMLFIFQDDNPKTFWMKDTLIPLDIIFINASEQIVKIQHAVPCKADPCAIYPSGKQARYVVEVSAGFAEEYNITENSTVGIII